MAKTSNNKAKKSEKSNENNKIKNIVFYCAIAVLVGLIIFTIVGTKNVNELSDRDAERKEDLAPYIVFANNYQANNRGKLPDANLSAWETAMEKYGISIVKDGNSGLPYRLKEVCMYGDECTKPGDLTWGNNERQVYITYHATCDGDDIKYSAGTRKIAVFAKRESAGIFCASN